VVVPVHRGDAAKFDAAVIGHSTGASLVLLTLTLGAGDQRERLGVEFGPVDGSQQRRAQLRGRGERAGVGRGRVAVGVSGGVQRV
jgi:hypothetical protein